MRIAWITPFLPAPTNSGGRIRVSAFADALAEEELVLFARLDDNDVILPRDGERLGPFSAAYARPSRPVDFRILPRIPERVRRFPERSFRDWSSMLIRKRGGTRSSSNTATPTSICRKPPGVRVVLNEHNVESEYFRRRMRVRPTIFPASVHPVPHVAQLREDLLASRERRHGRLRRRRAKDPPRTPGLRNRFPEERRPRGSPPAERRRPRSGAVRRVYFTA